MPTTRAPTTATTEALTARWRRFAAGSLAPLARRARLVPSSLRTRILVWFIGLLVLATVASVLVTREVLHLRIDEQIDHDLVQESLELRRLANGNDPETGRPFGGSAERIFEAYLQRNVASRNEALITFVDGRPFLRSRQVVPYRLDTDPALVERWATIREPDRGSVDTPAGRVEYLAVPLKAGERTAGVFVAAIFRERALADSDAIVRAAGAVGLAILLLGSLLAWRLADRVLTPVTELTTTARAITETDLSRRIPVRGRDEIAQLTATANEMLDRLEDAFAAQRRFVDDAGHELKTPLTIVRGHLELLEDDPEQRRETLALVVDELDRMSRIVDDLLLLAKHEQPDFLDLTTVEVGMLTDELEGKVSALSEGEWVVASRGRGVIVADRQRLTQALMNLASNAVEHTVEGDRIAIGAATEGAWVRLWVADTGPGVPAADRERIFERFARGRRGA
ncbi:MAG TPA: histidine kinase dimerization/phospho-acceptor domain-containing protein, partial [Gaiellaceae bacterium]|nr:histidine kinase dimerization/phospho-acceptor domain-containing protein [Gaiellaceae bacterium]